MSTTSIINLTYITSKNFRRSEESNVSDKINSLGICRTKTLHRSFQMIRSTQKIMSSHDNHQQMHFKMEHTLWC